ncbi:MSMEG_1061 family FMN-dependent PPOX-type flavoprotein [Saccharopolyspora sp. CA-218241]|uniref:MSMEG_1061 family FMN-dependent PPOX-type flavoprotein n=1 Tax=Saccharopolyspora sp. CA-218241 TaxID=3240027 RepID=UPI003D98EABB
MSGWHDLRPVTDETHLREFVETPHPAIADKAAPLVDAESRRFIAASPLVLVATTGDDGTIDVSPRGDPPGSVLVSDDGHDLAIPDRRGNRRLDTMRNLLRDPRAALIFLIPGVQETLRVNGTATVVHDGPFFDRMADAGTRPHLAVVVHVREVFVHCGQSLNRSRFWRPESWPDTAEVPSVGTLFSSQAAARDTART